MAVNYLFNYYPYDEIAYGVRDKESGLTFFALLYHKTIVALGIKETIVTPRQYIYSSIIQNTQTQLRFNTWKLKINGIATFCLFDKIGKLKIAKFNDLPEPPKRLIYTIYGTLDGNKKEFRIYQYPWFNRHKRYLLTTYDITMEIESEMAQDDDINVIADIISKKTERKIKLV